MIDTSKLYDLESRQVPFLIDPLPHAMLWSAARGNDPEIAWLRSRLRPIVRSNFANVTNCSSGQKQPRRPMRSRMWERGS
jgi:hypothetical protein